MNANRAENADNDQGVIGPDVGIERRWVGFLGHGGGLRQTAWGFCEVDHIGLIFFAAAWFGYEIGNDTAAFGLPLATDQKDRR